MGSITKATAEAPCPLFAGRGLHQRGFTIQMPQKEYLSCAPENMDQEKGILGIYNYDLAERPYNDSADVVAFQIYCKTGDLLDDITTGRNIHGLDVWVEADYAYDVTTNLRNADIRAARIQCQADAGVEGVVTGLYVNSKLKGGSTYLGRYLESTSSYGAISIEVRSETSGTGTVVAGDGTNYGMAGAVFTAKFSNALTGNYHAIALNCPYEGGAISGSSIGMYFFNTVILTGTAFDVGIDFGDSMVVKAIDIGDCTYGITFTGTATIGIDLGDETTTAIDIGACTTGIVFSGNMTSGIDFTGTCSDGYLMVGTSDSTLEDSGAVADQTAWVGYGIFTVITGASGRKAYTSGWSEDHAINAVLHQDGEAYFGFGIQGRYRILDGGLVNEVCGIAGRSRVASGGTCGQGATAAGQLIGVFGEADMVSGAIMDCGGAGIIAGGRFTFDDNGATWTTYGKRCAVSAEWEDGTADCVIYVLKHSGAESGGHGIEFNDPGTDATDLIKITSATGWGTSVSSFVTQSNDAAASLKIDINGTPYYIACYSAHHSS